MAFYLASKSPRRRELLKDAGFDFDILLSKTSDSVNEDVLPGESPEDYVARVTREKAKWGRKVAETERDLLLPVLAADTNCFDTQFLNHLDKALIHLIQNHFCNFHSWRICHTKAIDKTCFHAYFIHPTADFFAATVNDDRLESDKF